MTDATLKGEAYCRLRTIHKHYRRLQMHDFPTAGPASLVILTSKIVHLMLERFGKYTDNQVRHIFQLCSTFETIYGYLSDSKLSSVPWSVIPALEELFSRAQKQIEFAICPIWENNYKVITENIVELYRSIASAGDLLFDAGDKAELDSRMNKLFEGHPRGIYFLFFPRMERVSAVHFALLGHEIGHIYSDYWINSEFGLFLAKHDIEGSFETIAKAEYAKLTAGVSNSPDIFETNYVVGKRNDMVGMCLRVMREIVADIYGAMLFGDTALVAQYLFFLGQDIDDIDQWPDGYPSPRLRMKLAHEGVKLMKAHDNLTATGSGWEAMIETWVGSEARDREGNEYRKAFLDAVDAALHEIYDNVTSALGPEVFTKHVDEQTICASVQRLEAGIPPNALVSQDGTESPVDFRNILYASTRCLGSNVPAELEEYEHRSRMINLLGTKGIELSMEQERFRAYDSHQS